MPDATYGGSAAMEETVVQAPLFDNMYNTHGELKGWQESIGTWCIGNHRLAFAVCAALSGPLLALTSAEGGGFHFWGGSSLGKTTLLHAAGSVAGGGGVNGFLRQWRATDNGLEAVAAMHNDNVLCLDEIGQASAKVVAETAYMLANGQGKSRALKDGMAKKAASWRLVFLSTGEMTLEDKIREEGKRMMAGQAVRVVDIPADAGMDMGIFADLHGHEGGHTFSQAVKTASSRHYGHALRAWLAALAADRPRSEDTARKRLKAITEQLCPASADGQVTRVAERFALAATAGEMAIDFGLLPWPKESAVQAAWSCMQGWLATRGGTGPAEETALYRHVRSFFDTNGASRFTDVDAVHEQTVHNRVGYRRNIGGEKEYLLFPEAFRNELCLNMSPTDAAALLKKKGWLKTGTDGRATESLRIKGENGTRRMYRFRFDSVVL